MSDDNQKTILEYISEVDELLEISNFIGKDFVDQALGTIVHILHKPDIPQSTVAPAIVKLQAISSLCAVQASYYRNLNPGKAGTEEYKRKTLYSDLNRALDGLVNSLKYLCK